MSYINFKIKDYTIVREVSINGGQGAVYQATNSLGAAVAIKILHKNFTSNEAFRKHFHKEAMIMASIGHDHIVRALDYYEDEDTVAIIMEYLEGQDLQTYLEQLGTIRIVPIPIALKWYSQILPAFAHAHHKGLVHRDVKPSNFFLTASGNMKVLDFGIAKILENAELNSANSSSSVSIFSSSGTPYYKSKEHILRPASVNHLTDVYALGLMFYILTTGQEPYDTEQITDDILNKELPPVPGYPSAVMKVLLKATAKDRDHRYVDCNVFLSALQEAVMKPAAENEGKQDFTEEAFKDDDQSLKSNLDQQDNTTTRSTYAENETKTQSTSAYTPPPPPRVPLYGVYSPIAISIATFLGGGFSAGYFMSQNSKRLEGGKNATSLLLGWIIGVVITYLIIPKKTLEGNFFIIALLIQLTAAVGVYFMVESSQKQQIEEHLGTGGNYEPISGMIGLIATFLVIHFAIVIFGLVIMHYM
ncbi:hypothetical protein GCM10028806_34980 [Spirosoma terrae]|uniref:Serine/threonine protein kinase n=1 Tax=Spirosoma terrae TaxID=1968276 RepID=A0A6L9LEE6_9BACT|nr:serine/threonine-protein kinase [Spirosoma terrae]NDU97551.1 serine/threonine protein kinase [Spirosoma terrae]